ncbi:MAG TPA: hypothetical protein VM260_28445, partial [Pirellula sp.]|nr:hypothetical protein [Pirellula sp.]
RFESYPRSRFEKTPKGALFIYGSAGGPEPGPSGRNFDETFRAFGLPLMADPSLPLLYGEEKYFEHQKGS